MNYKKLFYILCLFVSFFLGCFYFFYKTERVIFYNFTRTVDSNNNTFIYEQKKIKGIYINEKDEEVLIPLNITDAFFDQNNPEIFLYNALFQYFRNINIYEVENFLINLDHIAINKKNVIINFHIDKKKDLTIKKEINLIKNIYKTTKIILPYIEKIYFYDDNKLYDFKHVESYFTEEMISQKMYENFLIKNENINYDINIIPLFSNHGEKIENIFEKNIFQDSQYCINFFKSNLYSEEWQKELKIILEEKKFIYFMDFFEKKISSVVIYIYPFFETEDTMVIFDFFERPIVYNENIINHVNLIKNKLLKYGYKVSVEYMPLKSILLCSENSTFITISGKDKDEIKKILDIIMQK